MGIGIWSGELRDVERPAAADAAAELEELGYTALWLPRFAGDPVVDHIAPVLDATSSLLVATGILNVWMYSPAETAASYAQLDRAHPGRFLLGLGISHAPLVDAKEPGRYGKPLTTMREYLDGLDAQAPPVPREGRVLAALGPKMLELARDRAAGAHPYFVPPEHTRRAREVLGEGPVLAPEQAVVLESDPPRAREIARGHVERYLRLPNYTNNLRRLGFGDDDLTGGGSDRLLDAIVAWGDADAVAARVREHFDAGADHVCIQALGGDPSVPPREQWRELAAILL
jgi:probable F420-dependent oxidoreductase